MHLALDYKPCLAEEGYPNTELSGYDIAKRSKGCYQAKDESIELWMPSINSKGEIHSRRFLRFRKDLSAHKRVVLKFIYPEDIRDTGFLNEEKPKEKYDTQFLYPPAVKKVRRISAANKEQRWVGSDFFYEDIQEIKLDDWNYRRLPDEYFTTRTIEKNIISYSHPPGLWDIINSPSDYDKKVKAP